MLKENCIKILGSGLSYFKAAYKNVTLDIDQAAKDAKPDSYTFSAEGFIPNSAEKYQEGMNFIIDNLYIPRPAVCEAVFRAFKAQCP